MTQQWIYLAAAALLVVWILNALKNRLAQKSANDPDHWPVYAKRLLTPVEQTCYHRLRMAFPEHIVLAQVSVSQLLGIKKGHGARYHAIFNRFRQLTADFVVCNKDFSIAAVFEVDDMSHDRPASQERDSRKMAALAAANIPLHRLNSARLPDEIDLRAIQSSLRAARSPKT